MNGCNNPRLDQLPDGSWRCPECRGHWTAHFVEKLRKICCAPASFVPNCVEAQEVHTYLMQQAHDAAGVLDLWATVWEKPKRDKTCKTCGKKNDPDATHCWWCTCRFQD